jgi:hypothetical protein
MVGTRGWHPVSTHPSTLEEEQWQRRPSLEERSKRRAARAVRREQLLTPTHAQSTRTHTRARAHKHTHTHTCAHTHPHAHERAFRLRVRPGPAPPRGRAPPPLYRGWLGSWPRHRWPPLPPGPAGAEERRSAPSEAAWLVFAELEVQVRPCLLELTKPGLQFRAGPKDGTIPIARQVRREHGRFGLLVYPNGTDAELRRAAPLADY